MDQKNAPPTPGPHLLRLDAFVGTWRSEGTSRASPFEAEPFDRDRRLPVRMSGMHTYEWLPGRFFLLHRWDQYVGSVPFRGIWVAGYDDASEHYTIRLFDDQGHQASYAAGVRDLTWTVTGEAQRASIVFSPDGNTMTQRWEVRDATAWQPLCDVTAVRADP